MPVKQNITWRHFFLAFSHFFIYLSIFLDSQTLLLFIPWLGMILLFSVTTIFLLKPFFPSLWFSYARVKWRSVTTKCFAVWNYVVRTSVLPSRLSFFSHKSPSAKHSDCTGLFESFVLHVFDSFFAERIIIFLSWSFFLGAPYIKLFDLYIAT